MSTLTSAVFPLTVAPAQVIRGRGVLQQSGAVLARLGQRPLVVVGDRTLATVRPLLHTALESAQLQTDYAAYHPDCSEKTLTALQSAAHAHQTDLIIGVGGGKALDAAKLLAHQLGLSVVTIPTSAATCAAWRR